MISLLTEAWLPVRRKSGHVDWITPQQISEPDIVCFAASRADFNGALAQFMIGLLQTTAPVRSEGAWDKLLDAPPSSDELERWFAASAPAMVFDGDGARFMQDLGLVDGADCTIDALLIDAAGGSAIDKNTDHFVKRETVKHVCPHCAATALLTLQTNAPAGGAGHRTSLRGGGPLTTLIVSSPPVSLWQDLWLNVQPQGVFLARGDAQKSAPYFTFPWLAETASIQKPGAETQPLSVHPCHVFWAMPRRIRLDFSDLQAGQCDLCKRESDTLLRRYVTKPQGLNYKGPWRHPFSPYYETKEGWLPVHPQPGGFSYRNWLAWVLNATEGKKQVQVAETVNYAFEKERQRPGGIGLWVFGYDMDNMKARCWYETTFPLYTLANSTQKSRKNLQELVSQQVEAAELAVFYLRQAVRHAWFGDADSRGDLSFIDKAFWDSTEASFYRQLRQLIQQAGSEAGIDLMDAEYAVAQSLQWLTVLRKKVEHLFDHELVGNAPINQQDPRRIAQAHLDLKRNLHGPALLKALKLPLPEKVAKKAPAKKAQPA